MPRKKAEKPAPKAKVAEVEADADAVAAVEAPEDIAPAPQADQFDALLAAVKDTTPTRMVDKETGFIENHGKPADDHHEAKSALEAHVQAVQERLSPDHPEVERKRRLMNIAFR